MTNETHDKAGALAKFLDCDLAEAATAIDDGDWLVLTDAEADEAAREYILDSLWAFRPCFLSSVSGIDKEVFEALAANNRCEANNDAVTRLVAATEEDKAALVSEAIAWDGRGHFLSRYDGEEVELDGGLFAYRCN